MSGNKIADKLGCAAKQFTQKLRMAPFARFLNKSKNGKVYEFEYYVYSADARKAAYDKTLLNSIKQPKWVYVQKFMAYVNHQMELEKQSQM